MARAFHLSFRLLLPAGPELIIRVNRIVPQSSAIFTLARSGDLEGVRQVLSQGLGSPFDVDNPTGMSALGVSGTISSMNASFNLYEQYALIYGKFEVAQALLHSGADANQEDYGGMYV